MESVNNGNVSLKVLEKSLNFLFRKGYQPSIILILEWGSLKCGLQTDYGLLFLGLENNGTAVTISFAW